MRRAVLLAGFAALWLTGCGFTLRQAPEFAFGSVWINAPESSPVGQSLKRQLAGNAKLRVVTNAQQAAQAEVILDITHEQRERIVVGLNTAGQVRNFALRERVKFRLRTPQGKELIAETEIAQQREVSYVESAALAKEAEQAVLYRDMQNDITQLLLRRLAAVKAL